LSFWHLWRNQLSQTIMIRRSYKLFGTPVIWILVLMKAFIFDGIYSWHRSHGRSGYCASFIFRWALNQYNIINLLIVRLLSHNIPIRTNRLLLQTIIWKILNFSDFVVFIELKVLLVYFLDWLLFIAKFKFLGSSWRNLWPITFLIWNLSSWQRRLNSPTRKCSRLLLWTP
jgi:hypothetical protein